MDRPRTLGLPLDLRRERAFQNHVESLPLQWNTERFLREGATRKVAERTFSIIKPDAVADGHASAILTEIDKAGFRIVAIRKESITKREAEGFYAVHSSKPFFADLTDFMAS